MKISKISIIIPIYNAEKFLTKSIESAINQTYKNIEIILVNDGSTDNSLKICENFLERDKRIKLIDSQNNGVSYARNLGLKNASGEYIFFLDSDDWIDLNTIEIIAKEANENDADIVKINYYNSYSNGKEKINNLSSILSEKIEFRKNIEIDKTTQEFLFSNTYILNTVWGELIKKSSIKDTFFCNDITYGEDLLFNFEIMSNANKVVFITDPYYHYFINKKGINQNYDFNILCKKIKNLNCIYEKIIKECNNKEDISYKYVKEVIDNFKKIFLTNKKMRDKKVQIIEEINNSFFKCTCENINFNKISKRDKILINMLKRGKFNFFVFYANIFYKNIWFIKNIIKGEKNEKRRIKGKN